MVEKGLNERTRQTIEAYSDCLANSQSRKAAMTILNNPTFQAALQSQGIDVEAVKKALLKEEKFI